METLTHDNVPTSFGVFKPVGCVMLGLPTQALVDLLVEALGAAGWPREHLREFAPRETVPELEAMIEGAGPLAGFGYEITMLRRYLELAREGARWLLVTVDGTEQAAQVAEVARSVGARLAVHYRGLTVEELIQAGVGRCSPHYPKQRVLVVSSAGYAYLVPFVEESDHYLLKTVIPSCRSTCDYLSRGDQDAQA